ncbi:MAG: transcription elongation factor GreB [Polyangiales bacterium]
MTAPTLPYITPEGAAHLRRELQELWYETRPKMAQAVAVAAAEGDRSENAEYIYGKKRLREIDRRIRFLSQRLERLQVATLDGTRRDDRIYFGAWVQVEDEQGHIATHRIVGADEVHLHAGGISIDAPVARALLGRAVDDEVQVRRPRGETTLTVLAVQYVPFA